MQIQSATNISLPAGPVPALSAIPRDNVKPPVSMERVASAKALPDKVPVQPSQQALQQAVDHSNKVLESKSIDDLHFSVDKDTHISVVKLIDRSSGETIMQMPSADMLKIAKSIDQFIGALVQKTA